MVKNKEKLVDSLLDLIFTFNFYMKKTVVNNCNINGKSNKDELTIKQFALLILIRSLSPKCTLTKLVGETFNSKGALSIILSKLEEKDLIRRIYPDKKDDRRNTYLELTESGEKEIEKRVEEVKAYIANSFDTLDEEDIFFLEESVPRFIKIFKGEDYEEEIFRCCE